MIDKLRMCIKKGGLLRPIQKVGAIREEKGGGEETGFFSWLAQQCSVYSQYKKIEANGAMLKYIGSLHMGCQVTMKRDSPTVSPYPSEDREEDNESDGFEAAIR